MRIKQLSGNSLDVKPSEIKVLRIDDVEKSKCCQMGQKSENK
jgi:hypothetical protein